MPLRMHAEGSKLHSVTCVTDDLVSNFVSKKRAPKFQTASQKHNWRFAPEGLVRLSWPRRLWLERTWRKSILKQS
jgi:hypothetical protein